MPRSVKALWLLFGLLLCLPLAVRAGHGVRNTTELPYISQADLPAEARDTLHLIEQGGPFPYPRDGVVFGNYEHKLPQPPRGCTSDRANGSLQGSGAPIGLPPAGALLTKSAACGRRCEADAPAPKGSTPPCRVRYHEYTVPTPGVRSRGARRIVCGVIPECYYTADHYRTFRRIRE
jgi:ribonuclease T1